MADSGTRTAFRLARTATIRRRESADEKRTDIFAFSFSALASSFFSFLARSFSRALR